MSDWDEYQKECAKNAALIKELMPTPKFIEYWFVEHNHGIAWFAVMSNRYDKHRFTTGDEAIEYCKTNFEHDVQSRIVHVTVEREANKTITTETRTEITKE